MHSTVHRFGSPIAAAAVALGMVVAADGAAQPQKSEVRVTAVADRYVPANRLFDDLDKLEIAVAAIHAAAIRLDACGSGTERAQMAAAHRFRHLRLELRLRSPDSPDCASAIAVLTTVSHRSGQRPFGIDDETVDRWKYHLMP
jgi:hypothetical protein